MYLYILFKTVSYKVPVPTQDEPGPSSKDSEPGPSSQDSEPGSTYLDSHTEAELDEARDILSEILNDIFTTRKGRQSMIYLSNNSYTFKGD